MNISNILTIIRIAIIPIIVLCIYLTNPYFGWIAFILFCLAGITDYFDGYLARLRNEVTNFGTFLDFKNCKSKNLPSTSSTWITYII